MCTMLHYTARLCTSILSSRKCQGLHASSMCNPDYTPSKRIPAHLNDAKKEMDLNTPVSVQVMQKGSVRTAVLQQNTAGSVESGKQRSFSRPVFDRGSLCLLATPTFTWLFSEQTLHPHGGNGTR